MPLKLAMTDELTPLIAEVMSIGDEIISGQRLDTNTQWLAAQLSSLGIDVRFHSSVGDDLANQVAAIQQSINRADIVLMTGGLGPTADDLTRTALAAAAKVELELISAELLKIEQMFARYGREMPANNKIQAYFPKGSQVIPNPEGTAPGIDLTVSNSSGRSCRLFALPGVPVEMQQMWNATVQPTIRELANSDATYQFHTLHCFGAGESAIEAMLPELIQRGRDPKVGITASAATITLRVSTRGKSVIACQQKMEPTIQTIRDCLGDLVFAENDITLPEVVLGQLRANKFTVAISDQGLDGEVAKSLINQDDLLIGMRIENATIDVATAARSVAEEFAATIGIGIGWIDFGEKTIAAGGSNFEVAVAGPQGIVRETFRFGGHSEWRKQRAVKQVLNQLRLVLRHIPNA